MTQSTIQTFTKTVDMWVLLGKRFLCEWSERYGNRSLYADVNPRDLFGEFRNGPDGRFRWDEALDAASEDWRLVHWGYSMYVVRCHIGETAPALFAEIRALGGEIHDAAKVVHHARYATYDRWKTVRRIWPDISASLAAMEVATPGDVKQAGQGKPEQDVDLTGELTGEMKAILFIQERLKTTGKLPTKKAIADLLEVHPRTLLNWGGFTAAYAELERKHGSTRRRPRGEKSKDGNLEAWQD